MNEENWIIIGIIVCYCNFRCWSGMLLLSRMGYEGIDIFNLGLNRTSKSQELLNSK